MSSPSVQDYKIASLAAGFTIGFGILTIWTATQQTMTMRSPLRSAYMYMVWGEILANFAIGIVAWLYLDGNISGGIPVYFFILFFYVFEVQLLMQIIINRIAVVAEDRRVVEKVKWGTAGVITTVNVLVFIIWIPAHLGVQPFVHINEYWDRTSKVIILLVDAGLNWWFLKIVKDRLVAHHGLTKYQPLVTFNGRLLILSIAMDAMLIGLMSLRNQVVYIQFHPVAYMVKLNIEMSMAQLITKLARGSVNDRDELDNHSSSENPSRHLTNPYGNGTVRDQKDELHLTELSKRMGQNHSTSATAGHFSKAEREALEGIHTKREVNIMVEEESDLSQHSSNEDLYHANNHSIADSARRPSSSKDDDDVPLKKKNDDGFVEASNRFNNV